MDRRHLGQALQQQAVKASDCGILGRKLDDLHALADGLAESCRSMQDLSGSECRSLSEFAGKVCG